METNAPGSEKSGPTVKSQVISADMEGSQKGNHASAAYESPQRTKIVPEIRNVRLTEMAKLNGLWRVYLSDGRKYSQAAPALEYLTPEKAMIDGSSNDLNMQTSN